MFDSLFPSHWSDLQKLMWLKILKGGTASYETIVGNPVSFTAKAAPLKQLKVAFSPKQDLHGYDSPWPAGGGANKYDSSVAVANERFNSTGTASASGTTRSDYIPCIGGASYYALNVHGSAVMSGVYWYDSNKEYISYESITGISPVSAVVTAPANAAYVGINMPSESANNAAFNYPSSVTTYSPYSNECPILGWDSLNVEQTNANLAFVDSDHVIVYAGRGAVADGAVSSAGEAARIGVVFSVTPNTEYSLTFTRTAGGTSYYYIYEYSGWPSTVTTNRIRTIKGETGQSSNTKINQGFTTGAGAKYVALVFYKSYSALDYSYDDICLKLGANNYDVVEHAGRSISISLGQTVYSGTVDVVTGVVTVTMASSDLGSFNWQSSSASVGRAVETTTAPAKTGVPSNVKANILCSAYKTDVNDNIARGITGICVNRFGYIKIQDASFIGMTFTEIKAALTGVQAVYELAEPIPIQLTPQEVESLAGDNTLWSDANQPLTVTYRSN